MAQRASLRLVSHQGTRCGSSRGRLVARQRESEFSTNTLKSDVHIRCFSIRAATSMLTSRCMSSIPEDPVRTFESENPELFKGKTPDHEKIFFEDFEPGEEIPIVPLPPFDDGSGKILASPKMYELADRICKLSLIENYQLSQLFADHFGFDESFAESMGTTEGGAGGEQKGNEKEAVQEKTTFDLKLASFDDKSKIKVIKEVRSIAELGLKEAKALVEGAPKIIKKGIKKEEAQKLLEKLEAVGAKVEIV